LIACSTIHPSTDQGFARSAASQAAATDRANRLAAPGGGSGGFAAVVASKWSSTAPSAGSSTLRARGQQRIASDSTVPERRCQRRRWRHQITRPQFFISPGHTPNRIPSNLPSAADAARLARPQLETVEQDSHHPKQRSGEQVRMKLPASTPHSISHHRCLPVHPDSGAGFIVSAHYALQPTWAERPPPRGLVGWRRRHHFALFITKFPRHCCAGRANLRTRARRVGATEPHR
jgi:hypothetical protein